MSMAALPRTRRERAVAIWVCLGSLVRQEAYERDWRAREKAEAERQRELNEVLTTAREQQKTFRLQQLAETAVQEKDEFYSILQTQQQVCA